MPKILLGLMLLLGSSLSQAHYLDIAQFTLSQLEQPGGFRMLVDNLPQTLVPDQAVGLPPGCEVLSRRQSQPGMLPSVELSVSCSTGSEGEIETQWGRDGGMLEYRYLDGRVVSRILTGGRSGMNITLPDWDGEEPQSRGLLAAAWLYLLLGTEHVLIGWDHLAFVFCLALLASGGGLFWLITSFTLGHSLSLALSFFGIVNIAIAPVEAVIALSVVFMAREAVLHQYALRYNQDTAGGLHSLQGRMALTAGFGLIHGLGFASVLDGLGVTAGDTVIALAFFNIGVETGQVLFVVAVLSLLCFCRRMKFDRAFIISALSLIGTMGLVWTLQRI